MVLVLPYSKANQLYVYTYSPFSEFPSHLAHYRVLRRVPVLSRRSSLVICFVHSISSVWASLVAQMVKNLPTTWETWVPSLGWEDSLEKGMATQCCLLA